MAREIQSEQLKRECPGAKKYQPKKRQAKTRFRDPAHFQQLRNASATVCHGFIDGPNGKELHAWVEHNGLVIDLHFGITALQGEYQKMMNPSGVRRFTKAQLREKMDKHRTYGPYKN